MAVWPNGSRTRPTLSSLWKEYDGVYAANHWGLDSHGYYYNCAIDDAVISYIGWNTYGGGGREILYRLNNGDVIVYYHNAIDVLVTVGQRVTAGQRLGIQSNTGKVTGDHNHTEVWIGGRRTSRVNPLTYIAALVGSSTAGTTPTPTGSDTDMAQYDLIQTPDGTVWWCVDRVVRFAIPNPDALNTYIQFYKDKTGFTAKIIKKSAAEIYAYGEPVYHSPLSRYATPANIAGATKTILAALEERTTGIPGDLTEQALAAITAALDGIEISPVDYAKIEALLDSDKGEILAAIAAVDEATLATFGLIRIGDDDS